MLCAAWESPQVSDLARRHKRMQSKGSSQGLYEYVQFVFTDLSTLEYLHDGYDAPTVTKRLVGSP